MSADPFANQSRRKFLSLAPISVFAGILSSVGIAAFRALRPRLTITNSENWIDVAPLSELTNTDPRPHKITTEHFTGWAVTQEEHQIYVLPNQRVISAVCPHEGCEVAWDQKTKQFACPCHESYFAGDGTRLTGPARRGLDPLPARIQDGKLQVQYQLFENNSTERIRKA